MPVRVHRPWLVSVLVLLLVSSAALAAPPAAPQDLPELKALKYRLIGPAWGGRVSRVAGVAGVVVGRGGDRVPAPAACG